MVLFGLAKTFALWVLCWQLAFFYGSISVLVSAIRSVFRGKTYWQIKERKLPPKCVQDAKYGQHSYMKLSEVKLHYVENGDRAKPLMLFLHGFPQFWFSWRHQMKYFAKTHWVVAIDMRGYGDSDAPAKVSDYEYGKLVQDVVELVKALGREKCILVGHDWGGLVAFQVAMREPQIVEKLVVANTIHPSDLYGKVFSSIPQFFKSWYMFFFRLPYIPEKLLAVDDHAVFQEMLKGADGKDFVTPDELEAYKYAYGRRDAWVAPINYYRMNLDFVKLANQPEGPKIQMPVLFIFGEKDVAISPDFPELAKRHCTNMYIHYIPQATHFVQEDKPAEFNAALAAFLSRK